MANPPNPYAVDPQFTEAITPQQYVSTAPPVSGFGTKKQEALSSTAYIADKFLAGVSRGQAIRFQRQQQERTNLMQDVNRQYASLEAQKDDLTPEAYKQAKSQLDALHVLAVKTAVDKSEDKSPLTKGLKSIFEGIVGPGAKKFELGPEQIYRTLFNVNETIKSPQSSRSGAIEQAATEANSLINNYVAEKNKTDPNFKLTEDELVKIPGLPKVETRLGTLGVKVGDLPAYQAAKANTAERREVSVAKAREEAREAAKTPPTEDIKNLPGSALPPGTKDAFGNDIDAKGIYTRGRDNKLYPEAPAPKTEKEPSEAEKTIKLGEDLYRENHNLKSEAALDPKQKAAARKEYKESQETDEAKAARASMESSRALTELIKRKELGDQPTADDAKLIAEQVVSHRMAPEQMSSLVGGFGAQAAAFKRMVLREALKLDPGFNFEEASAEYNLVKSPGFQNTIRYMDSVQESIPLVVKRANELGNSNIRFVNGLVNMTEKQLSDPKLKKFQTDALLVSDEIAKILQGGGTGNGTSDAKLKQAGEIINTADSPKVIAAALDDVKELLSYRRTALTRGTYLEKRGAVTENPPTSKEAAPVSSDSKVPPRAYSSPGRGAPPPVLNNTQGQNGRGGQPPPAQKLPEPGVGEYVGVKKADEKVFKAYLDDAKGDRDKALAKMKAAKWE